ncbi:C6 transcription factor [Cordyceps javanica]|uniref:C6 transcription factor n=1 Tax=Cordyceps javanica TaxID=43265 RepID=A0A545VL45_9HYPO|nr:C6 transcription factor [Cordyceps javanica]TQW02435.1 C6 transcription factor [Cordyceps javanica]
MAEETIIQEFSVTKSALLGRMRILVEQALIAAKFASTVDVTVLQAVMFFVLVLRKTGEARSAGSLVGVIVHLSQCLRLHKDGAGMYDLTPFQKEMRRRLFWCVVVLDHRSAEDLGTDPMLPEHMWDTPLPLNINDDDICESTSVLPKAREGMTDMTFFLIRVHTLQTSVRIRRLASEEPGRTLETLDQLCDEKWQETREMLSKRFVDPNPSHELAWAAETMASCIISKMKLTDHCSFYSPEDAHTMTEAMQSRSTAQLTSAIQVIEQNHSANVDDRWAKWKWIFVAYSRWHGSAILFKEMLRRQWTPVSEQGWVTLHKIMGDSKLGELECLRDQPVMPLPFGFIYELTRNYRESEYARLRSEPDEARRLCDEAVREQQQQLHRSRSSGGDRSGVSASSLERWQRAAGLGHAVEESPAQMSSRGLIAPLGEECVAGLENALTMTQLVPELCNHTLQPTAVPDYDPGIDPWPVGEALPVEYMENILDELF